MSLPCAGGRQGQPDREQCSGAGAQVAPEGCLTLRVALTVWVQVITEVMRSPSPLAQTGAQQECTQRWMSDGYAQGMRVPWNPEGVAQEMGEEILFLKPPMGLRKSAYHGCKVLV